MENSVIVYSRLFMTAYIACHNENTNSLYASLASTGKDNISGVVMRSFASVCLSVLFVYLFVLRVYVDCRQ